MGRMIVEKPDLSVRIGRIRLKNPVLAASGTFGYGEEYKDLVDEPRYKCHFCGRTAHLEESLCKPMKL